MAQAALSSVVREKWFTKLCKKDIQKNARFPGGSGVWNQC